MKPGSRDPTMRFALAMIDCLAREHTKVKPELLFSKDLLFDIEDFVTRIGPDIHTETVRTYVLRLVESGAFSAWNQISKLTPEECNGLDFTEIEWQVMFIITPS